MRAGIARLERRKSVDGTKIIVVFHLLMRVMAEGVGFEPTVDLRPRRFSRPVP